MTAAATDTPGPPEQPAAATDTPGPPEQPAAAAAQAPGPPEQPAAAAQAPGLTELTAATERHAQARVTLTAAIESGTASHAYLFHGPRGVGKAQAARTFAAALLADGAPDPPAAAARALRNSHADLTWVAPSGAHEMLIDDIAEPVVRGATRTPMEGERRVFVLERVETMSADVANRLLKTLEEPAAYAHFILLTGEPERVLPTVVSRCQSVRFDPIPPEGIAEILRAEGVDESRAASCAALAGGDPQLARELAAPDGDEMRSEAGRIVACALRGVSGAQRPWQAVAARATGAGERAERELIERLEERVEALPKGREKNAIVKDGEQAAHRAARRVRSETLDRSLRVAALLLRDLAATAAGSGDLVLAGDRYDSIAKAAAGRPVGGLLRAAAEIDETRRMLRRNVSEELTLQALSFKLDRLLATA